MDGDIWFDKVAGQHGDSDTEVGWSTGLKNGNKTEMETNYSIKSSKDQYSAECSGNGNYTALINTILINWGDVNPKPCG